MAYGQDATIGLSFQNSYGTALQSSIFWLPILDESLSVDKPPLIEAGMRGVFDEGAHHEGLNMVAGDINMEADPISLGVLFKSVLGPPTTSVVSAGALFSHVFKPRTSDFDSLCANNPLTIEKYLGVGSSELMSDLTGTTLELTIANGEFVKSKVGFVGGSFAQQANTAASYPADTVWTWDQTSVSIGGAAKPEIIDMTLTLNESLEAQGTLDGTKTPSRIKRTGFRTMEIGGTLKFDSTGEYQEFLDQSERELISTFTNSLDVLEIKVPLLRYVDFKPNAGGAGELEVSFSGKGVYSVTSATAMQIALQNTQSGY